jgi:hypothetical protein
MEELERELDEQLPRPFPEIRDPRLEGAAEVGQRLFGGASKLQPLHPRDDMLRVVEDDLTEQPSVAVSEQASVAVVERRKHPWAI